MNKTEAYEWLLAACETLIQKADQQPLTFESDPGINNLRKAVQKLKPDIEKRRCRLTALRARREGKPTCPKWALP